MIRDGFNVKYTDEDKRNLVIKLHTPEETKESKRKFSRKQWKRRLIMMLLIILFVCLTRFVTGEKIRTAFVFIALLTAILMIIAEFRIISEAKRARNPHYVELYISQKLEVEYESDFRRDHYDGEFFYPVQAMDTTSKYQCRYYLSKDEYDSVEPGQTIQVNVIPKKLAQ